MRVPWRMFGVVFALGCPRAAPPVVPSGPERPPGLLEDMHLHGRLGHELRDAVIAGDLAQVQDRAHRLATHKDLEQPASWAPFLTALRDAATKVELAKTLDEAAGRTSDVAAACGACHAAMMGGPKPSFDPVPDEAQSVTARMDRHQWAAERMWDGLVAADPALFQHGAEALTDAPLWGEAPLPAGVAALEPAVRATAAEAAVASTGPERTAAYGHFLATCAGCHTVARPSEAP